MKSKLYYIVLLTLTVVVLTFVVLWAFLRDTWTIIAMLIAFGVYLIYFITTTFLFQKSNKRQAKKLGEQAEEFLDLLVLPSSKSVFVTVYCKSKHVITPREDKPDFYLCVTSHTQADQVLACAVGANTPQLLGTFALSYRSLNRIQGKLVVIDETSYNLMKPLRAYAPLFAQNEVCPVRFNQS